MILSRKHCSDESLIAYLDGELPFYRRFAVQRHLHVCWACRLRLGEIQRQVLEVAHAMHEDPFPDPQRIAEGWLAFLARTDSIAKKEVRPQRLRPSWLAARNLAWATACVVIAVVIWRSSTTAPPKPALDVEKVIAHVEAAEASRLREPIQQQFRIITRQIRPATMAHESRLEVWYEPARDRFASRLEASGGVLQHAIWQPEPSRHYIYDPLHAKRAVAVHGSIAKEYWTKVLFRNDLELNALERALLTWLEQRQWRPISLSAEVALFVSREQAIVAMEYSPDESGRSRVKLRARKQVGSVTIEFSMVLNERGDQPQVQSIRYESPTRVLELVFLPESSSGLMPVSFEPPASLRPSARETAVAETPAQPAPSLPKVDLEKLEIEVWYALHQGRACLGEPLEVQQQPDEILCVRGVVGTPERKEQIVARLAALGAGRSLQVSIQTAGEAWPEISAHSNVPVIPEPAIRLSRHSYLERYFTGASNGPAQAAQQFSDEALSRGDRLVAEAWALRHLSDRFAGSAHRPLDGRSHMLLETMMRDHLLRLRSSADGMQTFLAPVLAGANPSIPSASLDTPISGERWECLRKIFDRSVALNRTLLALFAAESDAVTPEPLVQRIVAGLHSIRAEAEHVASRLAAALPADTDGSRGAIPPAGCPEGKAVRQPPCAGL